MTRATTTARRTVTLQQRPAARVRRRRLPVWAQSLALLVVLLAVWEAFSGRLVDPFYLPAPSAIADALAESAVAGTLWANLWTTVQETAIGFLIGALAALVAGIVFGRSPRVAAVLDPFLVALNATPRVALAPLFVVWFGIGFLSKVILVITMVFFIVFYNTFQGVRSVDATYLRVATVMGASQRQIFRTVILPAATPLIVLGLKLSIPFALIGAVIGEFIASSAGLGYQIKLASNTYDTAGTMAGIFVLMVVAVLIDLVLNRIARRVLFWQPESTERTTNTL
ncbi:NitT/TauT family transport system permease protein [Pseudonocardia thermophila]|uniref:NitT/TauT family transport system permease protein n=1 Tax=Pseudonocardia thermophila TaxID=1848 RepID=A0A1M6TRR8_PSETH|nr:ABC transporter permease [Pseudonocardia thermophila]SHK59603.1 NitT/TauT family transport system permease protein [Pseudonocardia thermophila]